MDVTSGVILAKPIGPFGTGANVGGMVVVGCRFGTVVFLYKTVASLPKTLDELEWSNTIFHLVENSMLERTLLIDGFQVPRFLYGTAWKENETTCLTELALRKGFRGIDTANQRRHYHEAGVGQALSTLVESGLGVRDDFFLQTKFT